jgi:small-conductance mechanosensitive channel
MKTSFKKRILALLLGALVAMSSYAQDVSEGAAPKRPYLPSLESTWWSYFERPGDDAQAQADAFLDYIGGQTAKLQTPNQAAGQALLDAISDNLSAYIALAEEPESKTQELSEPAVNYSIDELLDLAAESREAASSAAQEQLEVEREQRILDGASRRRDLAFKNYLSAATGDERLLAALRLIQARSAQAIAQRRLQLLTQRYQRVASFSEATAVRVDFAAERLVTTPEDAGIFDLIEQVLEQVDVVTESREQLRAAVLAATGLDLDTEQGRSQQQLQQQQLVDAEVSLALAELALSGAQARRWWTELQLATLTDMGVLQDQALEWSELLRRLEQSAANWQRDTEDELLAVQTVGRDDLNRASRRLLDQRLGTAQGTLNRIGDLGAAVADLELISQVVDRAVAEYSGAFRSWFTGVSRDLKALSLRFVGLGDVTLFSVGEAPVTGGDILRVLIILIVAFLLSRGIRHAIGRVSDRDSAGTQASLYTVGRLTHYVIIIVAVLIALSTIGFDFGKLALIAGALGIGIGFGLQSIVGNFVSGLIILFEHSLRVGDYIELDTGLTGTVKSINVRSTLINTNDNIDIVVPNSEFVTARLTNWTLAERFLRVRIPFGVAYGSDKELVRKAAQEAAAEVSYTLTNMKGRDPEVWLVDFGDSSLDFLLLVWVNRQGARRPTRTRAAYLWELESKLTEYGIEIPFPQRDLNLRGGWPARQQAVEKLQALVEDDEPYEESQAK